MNKNIITHISPDKLTAYLSIESKPGHFPAAKEVIDYLAGEGIVFGVDNDTVYHLCSEKKVINNVAIAKGIPPEKGKDGQLVWHLDKELSGDKVSFDEAGLADYKHGRDFCEIKEGEQIVSRLPKVKGRDGTGVTGEILSSSEVEVELPIGEFVELSPDGLTLYARKSGFISYHNGEIEISDIYQVNGDVSFNTGNVKYDGKVVIKGDVRSGFRVEATGTIIVEGDVEACEIRSKNGDVIIKMGILGKGRAKIVAGHNVECGFVQDSEIKANNDVIVKHYIINSNVYAGNKVFVEENEGLIRGGKVFGEKGIKAIEAGSIKIIKTKLGLGVNKDPKQESILTQLVKEEDELYNRYELLSKKERFLKLLFERVEKFSEEKQTELHKISEELEQIKKRLEEIDKKRQELSSSSNNLEKKNKIVITDKLHQGVEISAGADEFYIDKLYETVMVYQDLDNIVIDDLINEQG